MKIRALILIAIAGLGLSGCDVTRSGDGEARGWSHFVGSYPWGGKREPFSGGRTVTVLATHHGEMVSYTLTPCGGARICGARTGTLVRTQNHYVVQGAYRGVTFWLSPSGDGVIDHHGDAGVLAWDWQRW